jgi:uncharacterized protein
MLCCLGPVAFDVKNDLQSIDFETQSNFARHEVMGAGPTYEDTGDGESTITLSGILLPFFFTGALQGISLLEAARRQKVPLTMIRGDFTPMGWVLIDSISHSHSDLDARDGVGHAVEYTIKLIRVATPASGAISILRLFQ